MSNSIYLKSCAARLLAITAMLILSSCGGGRSNDPAPMQSTNWVGTAVSVGIFAYQQYQASTAPDPAGRVMDKLGEINGKIDDLKQGLADVNTSIANIQNNFRAAFGITLTAIDELGTEITKQNAKDAASSIEAFFDNTYTNYLKNSTAATSELEKKSLARDYIDAVAGKKIMENYYSLSDALLDLNLGDTHSTSSVLAHLGKECTDKYNSKYPMWNTYAQDDTLLACYIWIENHFTRYLILQAKASSIYKLALMLAKEQGYRYEKGAYELFDANRENKEKSEANEFVYQIERMVFNTTKISHPGPSKLTPGYEQIFRRADFYRAQMLHEQYGIRGRLIYAGYFRDGPVTATSGANSVSLVRDASLINDIPYEQNIFQGDGTPFSPKAPVAIDNWAKSFGKMYLLRASEWRVVHYYSDSNPIPAGNYELSQVRLVNEAPPENPIGKVQVEKINIKTYAAADGSDEKNEQSYGNFTVVARIGGAYVFSAESGYVWGDVSQEFTGNFPECAWFNVQTQTKDEFGTVAEFKNTCIWDMRPSESATSRLRLEFIYGSAVPAPVTLHYSVRKRQYYDNKHTTPITLNYYFGVEDMITRSDVVADTLRGNGDVFKPMSITSNSALGYLGNYRMQLTTGFSFTESLESGWILYQDAHIVSDAHLQYAFLQF